MHDLDHGYVAGSLAHGDRRARDRTHLHLVDLGPEDAEAAAARAEHRIRLPQLPDARAHPLVGGFFERRHELVQRRIEEADRHR